MSAGELKELVQSFLNLIDRGTDSAENDERQLQLLLDRLALAVHTIQFKFPEEDFPDPPERNYSELKKRVSARFPDFGSYNTPDSITTEVGSSRLLIGDAIDDVADIFADLSEVAWALEHTNADDAMWRFEFGFQSHWGAHLRNLQLYLHYRKWIE